MIKNYDISNQYAVPYKIRGVKAGMPNSLLNNVCWVVQFLQYVNSELMHAIFHAVSNACKNAWC